MATARRLISLAVAACALISLAFAQTSSGPASSSPSRPARPASSPATGPQPATQPIDNFRLNYSTAGYDSRGTKVVLIRTIKAVPEADVSLADSRWVLKAADGSAAASGKIAYFGMTYGIQYWVADFSSFTSEGTYSMEVTLKKDAATSIGTKQTLPFTVQENNFTKTILIPMSLESADARKASTGRTGFYDATSAGFQEAYSHGIFLYGLLQMYKCRSDSLSDADKARLAADINIAFDHLMARWKPNETTLFDHPESGAKFRGGMNDIEPFFALALYIDMFKKIDTGRANDALFKKLVTTFNVLKDAKPSWQDTGYQQYKDYLIPAAVHMYRYSGDEQWKKEAVTRLNDFLAAFSLRTHYRGSARAIPLFDGLRLCADEFTDDPNHKTWLKQAQAIKDTDFKSDKIWKENVFRIITPCAAANPARDWDGGRMTGDMWGSLLFGYTGGSYAADALTLARLTNDHSLEKIAAGELYWDLGLNPGVPKASIANPPSATDRESAAFILNAPFRHVTGVTYRDFKMRNDRYMTLVNGFNANGGANEFLYVGTVSYNGEDFIKHDGCLIQGALAYEDYLAGRKAGATTKNTEGKK